MTRLYSLMLMALVAAIGLPAPLHAELYTEVESARANARAGGPTNARDAELLQRYGTLSGTPDRDWRSGERIQHKRKPKPRRDQE